MKKLLGFIAVVAIAFTLTMTVDTTNTQGDDLSNAIAFNIAEAKVAAETGGCRYTGIYEDRCIKSGYQVANCVNNASATNCSWTPPGDDIVAVN